MSPFYLRLFLSKYFITATGKVTKIALGSQEDMTTTGIHLAGCYIQKKDDAMITVM